jgi:PadR family transcriptional regulator PadR
LSPASNRDPSALTPLRPIELLILTMLSAGERHGYGLRQDIIDHTGGRVAPEAGNLYRHIRNLEDEGLIREAATKLDEGERRICYTLLPFGRKVLAAELARLRELARFAEVRGIVVPKNR